VVLTWIIKAVANLPVIDETQEADYVS